jgi:hypothetical protein
VDIKRLQNLVACHTIVKVPRGYFESKRIAEGVDNRMNFGG